MLSQSFFLLGDAPASARLIDADENVSLDDLKDLIASNFAIVVADGVGFTRGGDSLSNVKEILSSQEAIAISVDGHAVRDVPGPKGLPYVGNYFDVYPDHLGNYQRLFEQLGPVIQTSNMGRTTYHTNDPVIAAITLSETDFFTKKINEAHPLYALKLPEAGIFATDTDTPQWRLAHKFLPPAFGPRAVRHYAPTMQKTVENAYKVFDELESIGQSWNPYPYMMKLASQAVAELVLGMDLQNFADKDAPMHEIVSTFADILHLNKKVSSYGSWYADLPFGDPKRLRTCKARMSYLIDLQITKAQSAGVQDLPLQEAAEQAANVIDYAVRATDNKGEKLPREIARESLMIVAGAGFTTTSSLLSWLLYGFVAHPGVQEKLLQELIDNDFNDEMEVTPDFTDKLPYLNKYIKEIHRHYGTSFQPARTAKVDLILPGGYKMPKDSVIIASIYNIHHSPDLWENPAKFDPERWDTPEVKNRHKGTYIPFASGPRMCIGFNFALQEIKIFLPKLIYRYKFIKDSDETVQYDPLYQLIRPINLYLRTEKRVKLPPKTEIDV
ncbi:putative cytochrome P450 monooxygenase [Didymella exigua CBS 183.55]|uniref:Putative cytochrome P450 monooxygenase n=1 Tax=Didymella exigua CBS 183.55 TaxID=1150837 RepID=A0A6A5RED9_9PLEO|nr:putative cytochrome P450 monooxygenase [Didymella exigua CBS 183.55]KAF1924067.1 putative cytochrome P450 monooxygenase [Didymella exigua CBS 183.55]